MGRRWHVSVLRLSPAWAKRLLFIFVAYGLGMELLAGWALPGVVVSPVGLALLAGAAVLMFVSVFQALARGTQPGARLRLRLARAFMRLGMALCLAGLPASLLGRSVRSLEVGEGHIMGPDHAVGLPELQLGRVTLAPEGPNWLLSKRLEIEAFRPSSEGSRPFSIGLFPPTQVGLWRLSLVRFGYAPALEWSDAARRPIVEGWVMLGTFPHTAEEARLVTWTPEPNVMMGVGTFPPKLEDLLTPPGSGMHLFLRIEEATIGGARRDLRAPDAYRFLLDGRLEHPRYLVQVFRGSTKVYEARLRAGEEANFAAGHVRVPDEVLVWVEVLAVRDPWLLLVFAGLVSLLVGALLRALAKA